MTAVRRTGLVVLALALAAGLWELYKAVMPADGVTMFGTRILPRGNDIAMPHVSRIVTAFGQQEVSLAGSRTVLAAVLSAGWTTFRYAAAGFAAGVVVGALLALLMDRLILAERALLPWIVLSQTVPLIALAPLIRSWGASVHLGSFDWKPWMSVSVIAAYLAFFPVAIGLLRGLRSPTPVHRELFATTGTGWWQTLVHLQLPSAVPLLIPALRLAAAAAVVGSIVAEISTGLDGGIGRLIISYAVSATSYPARIYTAVLGAAVLGLFAAGLISVLDLGLRRYQRTGPA